MARITTGSAIEQLSGRYGGYVVLNSPSGLVLRQAQRFNKVLSPSQKENTERLRHVAALWQGLGREEAEAWRVYAAGITLHRPLDGHPYSPKAYNVFVGLSTKILQIDPAAEVPLLPPKGLFAGDSVLLEALPAEGGILLTASGQNSTGVVTEVALQKLPNARRALGKQFAAAAFHAFEPGQLSFLLPQASGVYGVAYRFVEAATGRQTLEQIAGVVEV
jgi:hypothetical protein